MWDASDKWTEELSLALVRWAMTNYKEFKKELNALIERQRKADVERQKQKEMNFVKKNLKKYEHIVSHWGTPRVHELKSREQLDDVLKTVADKKKAADQHHQHHLDRIWRLFDSSQDQRDRYELKFSERDRSRVDRERDQEAGDPSLTEERYGKARGLWHAN